MYRKIAKTLLLGQVVASVAVIIFGFSYCLRCLFDGLNRFNIFFAVCFALMGYVCGYLLLYRASVRELRKFNAKQSRAKS